LMPLLVIVAILAAILPCAICLAQALPDSGPSINAVYAFQNLAQSGDQLYLIDETTTYTTAPAPPPLTFGQAFVVRLIAADVLRPLLVDFLTLPVARYLALCCSG
jgi:hypothetical protein